MARRVLSSLWNRKQLDDTNENFKEIYGGKFLTDGSLPGTVLENDSVGTQIIKNEAVTEDKIKPKNVTKDKLAEQSIDRTKLDNNLKKEVFSSVSIDEILFVKNSYINYMNGKSVPLVSSYYSSDFVEIGGLNLELIDYDLQNIAENARGIAYYKDKTETSFISGIQYKRDIPNIKISVPENANYLRFTTREEVIDVVRLSMANISDSILKSNGEISKVSEKVDTFDNQIKSIEQDKTIYQSLNLIKQSDITWSKYINSAGNEANYSTDLLGITDFLEINENSILLLGRVADKKVTDIRSCAYYDKNKTPIKIFKYADFDIHLNDVLFDKTVSGAKYFRASVMKTVENPFVVVENLSQMIARTNTDIPNSTKPLSIMRYDGGYTTVFHKIGFVGDSLSYGSMEYIGEDGLPSSISLYQFSFGQRVGKILGNEVINFSKGGYTAKAAYNAFKGEWVKEENKCTAYNIYLGTNDRNTSPYVVGTKTDIDMVNLENNADSYYGWYGRIIQTIQIAQPRAKIFLMTLPKNAQATKSLPYNDAIKELATLFDNCFVIDTFNDWDEQTDALMAKYGSGTHLNAMGYQKYAYDWVTHVNYIIENNIKQFRDVAFIGRDEEPYFKYN